MRSGLLLLLVLLSGCSDPVLSALRSEDREVRANMCVRLIADPMPEAAIIDGLNECVQDDDTEVRRLAIQALGQLGPAATPALSTLRSALEDLDEGVRVAAAVSLLQIDPSQVPPREILLSQVRAGNPRAIRAIRDLGYSASWAAPEIRKLLGGRHTPLHNLARSTLTAITAQP